MDKETYEKQRPFAGEKKPSMLRRCVGHDYTERQMYMVTMVTEGRRPLLGTLVGNNEATARIELSELGKAVEERWMATSQICPEIDVVALQIMPDHLHGILFVREKMECHLGMAIKGFKTGCNKAYRRIILGVQSVATRSQQTQPTQQTIPRSQQTQSTQQTTPRSQLTQPTQQTIQRTPHDDRSHGLLFA